MAGVEGRVALITGSGRGIGLTAAKLLASRGAKVMCVSRSEAELAANGLDYVAADLGTEEGCAEAVTACETRLGPIDIFVCNHGIGSAHERVVWEQDPDLWAKIIRINLDGAVLSVPAHRRRHGQAWLWKSGVHKLYSRKNR